MAFYPLEKLHRLHDGYSNPFRVGGRDLLLVQSDGVPFVIENRCPHMDAPLTYASVTKGRIRCPLHGIEFDLRTGRGTCAKPLHSIPIVYDGNQLGVELELLSASLT